MACVKQFKIKIDETTFSDAFDLGAKAENVDVNLDNNVQDLQSVINLLLERTTNISSGGEINWNED